MKEKLPRLSIRPASEGKVHADVINGKLVATFCAAPVTGQPVTFATTASGKISEN